MKSAFFVLYILTALGMGGLFLASCRVPEPDVLAWNEGKIDDPGAIVYFEEGQDIILSSYLDPELQEKVLDFFEELTGSRTVASVILANAAVIGIPPALAFALCAEESSYNPQAFNRNRNSTVDRGLFQLNSASFPQLKTTDFYDLGKNAWHGLSHLRWCLNTGGTEVAALAMYNAGAGRVRSSGTPKSTLDYVSRILKRQRRIEERFMAEYARIAEERSTEVELANEKEKAPLRLSLLIPLGRR